MCVCLCMFRWDCNEEDMAKRSDRIKEESIGGAISMQSAVFKASRKKKKDLGKVSRQSTQTSTIAVYFCIVPLPRLTTLLVHKCLNTFFCCCCCAHSAHRIFWESRTISHKIIQCFQIMFPFRSISQTKKI